MASDEQPDDGAEDVDLGDLAIGLTRRRDVEAALRELVCAPEEERDQRIQRLAEEIGESARRYASKAVEGRLAREHRVRQRLVKEAIEIALEKGSTR